MNKRIKKKKGLLKCKHSHNYRVLRKLRKEFIELSNQQDKICFQRLVQTTTIELYIVNEL